MNRILPCFGLLIVLSACTKQKNNTEETSSITESEQRNAIDEDQLNQLKDNSPQKIDQLSLRGDTLDIISSGALSYKPFGFTPFKDSLQSRFEGIFNVEVLSLQDKRKTYKLSFNKSFVNIEEMDSTLFPAGAEHLAEYRHQKPDLALIKGGYIKDKNVQLVDGIHVGMKKSDFFLTLFNNNDSEIFDPINTVTNGDAPGEYATQYYSFKQDTLSLIEFKYHN